MFVRLGILVIVVLVANAGGPGTGAAAAKPVVPREARLGSDGYATILDAPPAPFTPVEPKEHQPPTPDQLKGQEQFTRAAEFQRQVGGKAATVANFLRVAEKGNFVDFYWENEGEPHVVFRFLRNGRETLAKYIRDSRFVGADAQYTDKQLVAAMNFMIETFRDDRVIVGGGTGSKLNRAVVDIGMPEDEFRALVARKGVKIPDAVHLKFVATRSAKDLNAPLSPDIARLVRIFPRDDRPVTMLPEIEPNVKVVLRDGCFRAADKGDALVLFPLGAQLFIDGKGYLAFGSREVPGYARVGEELVVPGTIEAVTAPALVEPIHAACGPGKVVKIHGMRSAAADGAQSIVDTNAGTLKSLREMYGLPEAAARKALEQCKKTVGGPVCILSPPGPVLRPEDCPAGTGWTGGVCRTPEGYIRPLPMDFEEVGGS